jgi:inorganic pyrophosphatase
MKRVSVKDDAALIGAAGKKRGKGAEPIVRRTRKVKSETATDRYERKHRAEGAPSAPRKMDSPPPDQNAIGRRPRSSEVSRGGERLAALERLLSTRFQAHPWHGVDPGEPSKITAYVEITPNDTVKYELDKATGLLAIDRPQRYSSVPPALYGFIPKTYCGDRTGAFAAARVGVKSMKGDGDPLDICILTQNRFEHGGFLAHARVIGGFRMIDGKEADDKIIAVLIGDSVFGDIEDIQNCPPAVIQKLKHYFLTYKETPAGPGGQVEIASTYGRAEAERVIEETLADYQALRTADESASELVRRLLSVP